MDGSSLTFAEAEKQFAALEEQRRKGEIPDETYRERLNALRVKDDQGHTWMLQERTGLWFVYRAGAWEQATPPGRAPDLPPGPPPPPEAGEAAGRGIPFAASASALRVPPAGAMPPPPPKTAPAYAAPAHGPATPAAQPQRKRSRASGAPRASRGQRTRYVSSGYRPGCLKITWSIVKWQLVFGLAGWAAYDGWGQRYPWVLLPVALVAAFFMMRYLRRFGRRVKEEA